MAKDTISGLFLQGALLEWTTLQGGKDRLRPVASKRAELPEREDKTEAGAQAAAGDKAEGAAEAKGATGAFASQLKAECAGLKGLVSVGLPTEQVLLRVVSLPTTDDTELDGMVQLQVDKLSPFPVDTLVVSHEVLAKRPDSRLVLVAAAREAAVDAAGQTLRAAGIRPRRVDAAALGWWRLLSDAGKIALGGRQLVLILHGSVPEIIVFQDGLPILFRSLSGLEGLTEAELAQEIVREVGFTLMSLELDHGSAPTRAISVWHPQESEPPAVIAALRASHGREIVAGALSALPSVSEGLARRMADGDGVDLTPAAWRTSAQALRFRKRIVAGAAVLLGLWLLSASAFMGALSYQRLYRTRLQEESGKAHGPAMEVREMRRRVAMIKRYMERTDSALECLREVSAQLPDGIDLTSFAYRKGEGLKLSGVGQNVNQIYDFKKNLDASPLFKLGTTLRGVGSTTGGRQRFDLDLRLPGGPE